MTGNKTIIENSTKSSWLNVIENDSYNVTILFVIATILFYILANVTVLVVFGFFASKFTNPYYSTMKVSLLIKHLR